MSGLGEGVKAKLSDCFNWQHIVSQKMKGHVKGLKRIIFRPSHTHLGSYFALYLVILYSNIKCEGRRGRTVNIFGSARQNM